MRPLVAGLAVVVAALALPGGAAAATKRTLEADVDPSRAGTARAPRPVRLDLRLLTEGTEGEVPDLARREEIALGSRLRFNLRRFPSCSQAVLEDPERGPDRCPGGSQVGHGGVVAYGRPCGQRRDFYDTRNVRLTPAIRLFNAPGGQTLLAHLRTDSPPVDINAVVPIRLEPAGAPYGTRLVMDVPRRVQEPSEGLCSASLDMLLTIQRRTTRRTVRRGGRRKRVRVALLESRGCPPGGWAFLNEALLTDGARDTGSASGRATAGCS